jgi:hypothetical protein
VVDWWLDRILDVDVFGGDEVEDGVEEDRSELRGERRR